MSSRKNTVTSARQIFEKAQVDFKYHIALIDSVQVSSSFYLHIQYVYSVHNVA